MTVRRGRPPRRELDRVAPLEAEIIKPAPPAARLRIAGLVIEIEGTPAEVSEALKAAAEAFTRGRR